jgi:hypothetical protein
MRNLSGVIFVFLVILVSGAPAAGSGQTSSEMHFKPEEIVRFSKKVERTLASKGARVAIIARVGRPREKLPRGIGYTHTGIAVYSQITTDDGRRILGYAMRNLYQRNGKPDVSDLVQDYPVDFFSGVELLEAGVIVPSPELQERLLKVLASPAYKKLHNPKYSVIANPFTLDYQNCTEHTLDLITAAIYATDDINVIKTNEKAYFKAQPLSINPVRLAIGSMFSAEIATSDHSGQPVTATFETIGRFLNKYNAASEILTVTADM